MKKLTIKQEKFAQKYIELGNASEAYRQSYNASNMLDKSIWEKASELLNSVKVSARVAELREQHVQRHNVTVDSLTQELDEARLLSLAEMQLSTAVSATMGKAKLHGLLTDKVENSGEVSVNINKIIHSAGD